MARLAWLAAAASLPVLACGAVQARPAAELKCSYLVDIALPHASVKTITTEKLNDAVTACRIMVRSKPTRGEELSIEVWIPVGGAWNDHYRQVAGVSGDPRGVMRTNALAGFAGASVERTKGAGDNAAAERETGDVARTLVAALKGHAASPEPPPPPPPPPPSAKPKPKPPVHRRTHH